MEIGLAAIPEPSRHLGSRQRLEAIDDSSTTPILTGIEYALGHLQSLLGELIVSRRGRQQVFLFRELSSELSERGDQGRGWFG